MGDNFVNSPWIDSAANLVLIGDTGLGKTHIGSALCYGDFRGYGF